MPPKSAAPTDPTLSLFEPLLPPDPTLGLMLPEPEVSRSPSDGTLCARRVRFNAVALSRGLGQILPAGTRFGGSVHMRDGVDLFVYDDKIVLAADYVREDGNTMSLRYRIPAVSEPNSGAAKWMGVRVSALELMQQLRNRIEQSDRYGILAGEPLTGLELHTTADGEQAVEVRIMPSTPGAMTARVVRALGGADPAHHANLVADPVPGGFAEFPAEALLEASAVTHPDVGVLIDPTGDVGRIAGVGPEGIMVATFPNGPTGTPLDRAVVMSARQANVAGHGQFAMTGAFEVFQKARTNEHVARTLAAALAAALAVDSSGKAGEALACAVGAAWGDKVAVKASRGDAVQRAVAAAAWTLDGMDAAAADKVGRDLAGTQDSGTVDALRSQAGGDAAVARVAGRLFSVIDDPSALARTVARLRGEASMIQAAGDLVRALPTAEATERLRTSDLAVAAVQIMGTHSGRLTDAVLPTLKSEDVASWWQSFDESLEALGVPDDARTALMGRKSDGTVVPATSLLALPDAVKRAWLRGAQAAAAGRIGVLEDGSVVVSMGDDDIGVLTVTDRATVPAPEEFPLHAEAYKSLLNPTTPFPWSATLYNRDLDIAAARVAGTGTGDLADATESHGKARTIGIVRWVSPDIADKASRQVTRMFENESDRTLVNTDAVYLGSGASQRTLQVARHDKEAVADPIDVGTLRIFGLDVGGERLYLDIPVRALQRTPSVDALAVALDAEQMHDFFAFVTRRGLQVGATSVLDASSDGLRLLSPDGSRAVLLPAISRSRIPQELAALVAAANAEPGETVLMADVMERVRALPRRSLLERSMPATVRPPGRFVEWIPVRKVAATPAKRGRAYAVADITQEEEARTLRDIQAFSADAVGRAQALTAVSRRLQQLDAEIAEMAIDTQTENPLFGAVDKPLRRDSRIKQLRKLKARRDGVLAARATLVEVSDAPAETGRMRAGIAPAPLVGNKPGHADDALFDDTPGGEEDVVVPVAGVSVKPAVSAKAPAVKSSAKVAAARRSS